MVLDVDTCSSSSDSCPVVVDRDDGGGYGWVCTVDPWISDWVGRITTVTIVVTYNGPSGF